MGLISHAAVDAIDPPDLAAGHYSLRGAAWSGVGILLGGV
jgi:hypothetical protein